MEPTTFLSFLGRDGELETLLTMWERAKLSEPQLVVVTAPAGLGKTRLVQEFYARVSVSDDGSGDEGYWPDALPRERDSLKVSPDPADCNATVEMPFLWWGIKLVDSGDHRAGSADLHLACEANLRPHLAVLHRQQVLTALTRAQWREGRAGMMDMAKSGAEMALNFVPVVGPFVGVARTAVESGLGRSSRILDLEQQKAEVASAHGTPLAAASAAMATFQERLLDDLRSYCHPPDKACRPLILVVDDAQFAEQNAGLRDFLERVLTVAWDERWPLLLLLTHWAKEWNDGISDPRSLPGWIAERAAAELLQWKRINLRPLDNLAPLMAAAFPAIPKDQAEKLLGKARGNPRYLERLLQLLNASPAFFEGPDGGGALNEWALEEIIAETFDLHEVTRRLFETAPVQARQAAALAAYQGDRFVIDLIGKLAARLNIILPDGALQHCENPLEVIGGLDRGVGEFLQGIFREVAEGLTRRVLVSAPAMEEGLLDVLSEAMLGTSLTDEQQLLVLERAARTGAEAKSGSRASILSARAMIRLLDLSMERGDLPEAHAIVRNWRQGVATGRWSNTDLSTTNLATLIDFESAEGRLEDARGMSIQQLARARQDAGDNHVSTFGVAQSLYQYATIVRELDGPRAATPLYREAVSVWRSVAGDPDQTEHTIGLARALGALADSIALTVGPNVALPLFEEAEGLWADLDLVTKPTNADAICARCDNALGLADCLLSSRGIAPAEAALVTLEQQLDDLPDPAFSVRQRRARIRLMLAELVAARGSGLRAVSLFHAARAELEALLQTTRSPSVARDLARAIVSDRQVQTWLGVVYHGTNLPLESAKSLLAEVAEVAPSLGTLTDMARVDLAGVSDRRPKDEAVGEYRSLIERFASIHKAVQTPSSAADLVRAQLKLAQYLSTDNDWPAVRAELEGAVVLLDQFNLEQLDLPTRRVRLEAKLYLVPFKSENSERNSLLDELEVEAREAAAISTDVWTSDLSRQIYQTLAMARLEAGDLTAAEDFISRRSNLPVAAYATLGGSRRAFTDAARLYVQSRIAKEKGDTAACSELLRRIDILSSVALDQIISVSENTTRVSLDFSPVTESGDAVINFFRSKVAGGRLLTKLLELFDSGGGKIIWTENDEAFAFLGPDGNIYISQGGCDSAPPLLFISFATSIVYSAVLFSFACVACSGDDRLMYSSAEAEVRKGIFYLLVRAIVDLGDPIVTDSLATESPHANLLKGFLEDQAEGYVDDLYDQVEALSEEIDRAVLVGRFINRLAAVGRVDWAKNVDRDTFIALSESVAAIGVPALSQQCVILGYWLCRVGRFAAACYGYRVALPFHRASVAVWKALAEGNEPSPYISSNVLSARLELAIALLRTDEIRQGRALLEESKADLSNLIEVEPNLRHRLQGVQLSCWLMQADLHAGTGWKAFARETVGPEVARRTVPILEVASAEIASITAETDSDYTRGYRVVVDGLWAWVYFWRGDPDEALRRLEALEKNELGPWLGSKRIDALPDATDAVLLKGLCLLRIGELDTALQAFATARQFAEELPWDAQRFGSRSLAVIGWYGAQAAARLNRTAEAEALRAFGLRAANEFALFESMDAAAIVSAFVSAEGDEANT